MMLFPGTLIFFFSCVLRFVPVIGNFGFRTSRRFLDQPSFLSTRSNRVLGRGSLLDSNFGIPRTRTSLSPWREVNQRNYLDLSPRTSGRPFRNSWSSSTHVYRERPLYEMRENRSRRNNIHEILGRQNTKTSKEVLNSPVINGNEDRWVQRAGTGTVRSRRIEDLLRLMSQNRRADIFNPLKVELSKKTSAEKMSTTISRPWHVSSRHVQLRRLESLVPVEKKKTSAEKFSEPKHEVKLQRTIITRPEEVRNPHVFLRVRNTPVHRNKISQSLPMERNHILAEKKKTSAEKISELKHEVKHQRRVITRPKEVRNPHLFLRASNTPVQRSKIFQSLPMERHHIIAEKKKTSAEKISKSDHRTRLSNKNDSLTNQKILLLQRLNKYLLQQLVSGKHTDPKQTIQRSKKASKTSKEILKDNENKHSTKAHAIRTPEPLLSLTQRQQRRSHLLMEPMRFNPHRRRLPQQHHRLESSHGIQTDNQIRSNTVNSVIKSPASSQKPLFVLLNPFTGTVGSSTSSIQDKKKDTSKENKSGEKLTWVNP